MRDVSGLRDELQEKRHFLEEHVEIETESGNSLRSGVGGCGWRHSASRLEPAFVPCIGSVDPSREPCGRRGGNFREKKREALRPWPRLPGRLEPIQQAGGFATRGGLAGSLPEPLHGMPIVCGALPAAGIEALDHPARTRRISATFPGLRFLVLLPQLLGLLSNLPHRSHSTDSRGRTQNRAKRGGGILPGALRRENRRNLVRRMFRTLSHPGCAHGTMEKRTHHPASGTGTLHRLRWLRIHLPGPSAQSHRSQRPQGSPAGESHRPCQRE